MGDRLTYERFLWFHGKVKGRSYPNARTLADEFELSCRTAQMDIEFMRDRLRAPFQEIPSVRGAHPTSC